MSTERQQYEEIFTKNSLSRTELAEAVANLSELYDNFLLDCSPRIGKSQITTYLINKWLEDGSKILILSNGNSTNEQWLTNLEAYNPHLVDKTDIYCYQSLHKINRDEYDIICLDEFDLANTENRFEQILEFNPKHWIAMSGTLESEHVVQFRRLTKNKFFNVRVDFEQAVTWGILPAPIIYAVQLSLDNTKPYLVYQASKDKKKKNEIVDYYNRWPSLKDKKVNTHIKCTEAQYHELICQEFAKWKDWEEQFDLPYDERNGTVKFLQQQGFNKTICTRKKLTIGNERKKFFANIKNRHFRTLFNQLPKDARVLVFCNDTKQADLLNEEFAVHSNKPGSLSLVDQFNNKEIQYLYSIGMLERGQDFLDVDYLVIIH